MSMKHHCIICGNLIFNGLYCAGCSMEIIKARTADEESLEDWLSRKRDSRQVSISMEPCPEMTLDRFVNSN
jgi:hypothetical protein